MLAKILLALKQLRAKPASILAIKMVIFYMLSYLSTKLQHSVTEITRKLSIVAPLHMVYQARFVAKVLLTLVT